MTPSDYRYRESRDVWQDHNHRQEIEHDLINRKTTWGLTGQTILFAAYGVTLGTLGNGSFDKANDFRKVVALAGLLIAAITFCGVLAIINSKRLSWKQYREYYKIKSLPAPLGKKPLQWGVNTQNTYLTLAPDALLPLIFGGAWLCLLLHTYLLRCQHLNASITRTWLTMRDRMFVLAHYGGHLAWAARTHIAAPCVIDGLRVAGSLGHSPACHRLAVCLCNAADRGERPVLPRWVRRRERPNAEAAESAS